MDIVFPVRFGFEIDDFIRTRVQFSRVQKITSKDFQFTAQRRLVNEPHVQGSDAVFLHIRNAIVQTVLIPGVDHVPVNVAQR